MSGFKLSFNFEEVEKKLDDRFSKLSKKMQEEIDKALAKSADQLWNRARRGAPVDTGFLESEIEKKTVGMAHYRIISYADYSKYVEFGTWKMPPQPFMRPAWHSMIPIIQRNMKEAMKRGKS